MTHFYLIRHGEPLWSLADSKGLVGGRRDFVPLSPEGISQAIGVSQDPRISTIEMVVSSPYTRALHTAAILSRDHNVPLRVEFDLHEWLPDTTFQFDSASQVEQLHQDYVASCGRHPRDAAPKWETEASVQSRVGLVLEQYLAYNHVAVVCHRMVIRSLVGVESVDHAEIVEYAFG